MKIEIKNRPLKPNRTVPSFIAIRNDSPDDVQINKITLTVSGLNPPRRPIYSGQLHPDEVKYLTVPLTPIEGSDILSLNVEVAFSQGTVSDSIIESTIFHIEDTPSTIITDDTPAIDLPDIKPTSKRREKTKTESPAKIAASPEIEQFLETEKVVKQKEPIVKKEMTREDRVKESFTDEAAEIGRAHV